MEQPNEFKWVKITAIIIVVIGLSGGFLLSLISNGSVPFLNERNVDPALKTRFENYLANNYSDYKVRSIKNEMVERYGGEGPGRIVESGWLQADVVKDGEHHTIIYKDDNHVKTNIYVKSVEEEFRNEILRSCGLPEWLIKDTKLYSQYDNQAYFPENIKTLDDLLKSDYDDYFKVKLFGTAEYTANQFSELSQSIVDVKVFDPLLKYLDDKYRTFDVEIILLDKKRIGEWGGSFTISFNRPNSARPYKFIHIRLDGGAHYIIKADGSVESY